MHPDDVTWITNRVAITNFVSAHDKATLAEKRSVPSFAWIAA